MASTLLLLLLLVSLASASDFYGGTATFTYKGRDPDGSFKVDIRNRDTFEGCQDFLPWICDTGNCGSDLGNQKGVLDAPNYNSQWCETVETRKVQSDKPFQLRVPQNCPRTYKLMSDDPDGDNVRCRYGNVQNVECSACNQPSGFSLDQGSCSLHYQRSTANPIPYGFELVVEDFPQSNINLTYTDGSQSSRAPLTVRGKRAASQAPPTTTTVPTHSPPTPPPTTTTPIMNDPHWLFYDLTTHRTTTRSTTTATTPLSKLPLQFSILVDPPAPSCEEGLYLPKFMDPTPENGARIQAQVNKEVEIRVKAKAKYAIIHNIIFSGPLNINKHRTTHDEFVMKWTPVPDDLGDQYPVCFAVDSMTESALYQSEMRCVLVVVMEELVKSNVICHESTMVVAIEKSSFPGLHEDHLQLGDGTNTTCRQTHSNSTHIIAVVPLNGCGTEIEEDEENIIFKNKINTVNNVEAPTSRKHMTEVQFCCVYPKHGKVSTSFSAHRTDITVLEKGLGTFTYRFDFFLDGQFKARINPNSYPLEYDTGSRIYMQIEAVSTVNNTMLFVESCKAAPYDNPNYSPSYSIIDHGCKMDSTVETYSTVHNTQFRFSMEAFKFIGLHEQVYISCSVLMCEAGNPETRCAKGCMESGSWPNEHKSRRRRESLAQGLRHFISQGPLRLKRSPEVTGPPTVIILNLNLVFIAGCLLAAVGMICAVAMYKIKMLEVKYQPVPTYEN